MNIVTNYDGFFWGVDSVAGVRNTMGRAGKIWPILIGVSKMNRNRPVPEPTRLEPADQPLERLYRLKELPPLVGLQRTVICEMVKKGEFPEPIQLNDTGRALAWIGSELRAWQTRRIALRNSGKK